MNASVGPIANAVRVTDSASMVPPAATPEQRRRAGCADGLHQAGRYGEAARRDGTGDGLHGVGRCWRQTERRTLTPQAHPGR
jgi:hypothetical protein